MPPKLLFHGEHDFILMKRRRFGGTNLMLNQFIIPQMMENHMNSILVGGLEHVYFFAYIGNNDPNRLSHFSEGWLNHQPALISPIVSDKSPCSSTLLRWSLAGGPTSSPELSGERDSALGVFDRTTHDEPSFFWVNYNDLTATSLESWLIREIIPTWP